MTVASNEGFGVLTDATTICFERVLPGPIERVWEYLTDPDKRATWLAGGPMVLEEGGAVTLEFRHANLTTPDDVPPAKYEEYCDGTGFSGHVTRSEPPRVLSFTWAESLGSESEVTFELTPRDDGNVHLTLTHRRLEGRDTRISVASGWHTHLAVLEARLTESDPPRFWATISRMEAEYGGRLPE